MPGMLIDAGFVNVNESDGYGHPDYFEPFVRKNIRSGLRAKQLSLKIILFYTKVIQTRIDLTRCKCR